MKKKPSQVQEECDPEVYGENAEKKLQSIINSIGDQVRIILDGCWRLHCQQEGLKLRVAMKYNIPRSRIQRAMSGKKERSDKEPRQAVINRRRKETPSEEDSTRSLKIRRNEKELERIDDESTLDRNKQPDVQL